MLVLTRKIDEQIKIGDDITITIIKLRNNQVRIGIEAPRDVRVLRGELGEKTGKQKDAEVVALETQATTARTRRTEVIDGLMSADEMIALGRSDSDSDDQGGIAAVYGDDSPTPSEVVGTRIISRRIRTNLSDDVRAKRADNVRSMRAPLADFFSAT